MDSISIETSSSLFSAPDHISSFLEDFQDKNAHLFPSSDLSFDVNDVADSSPSAQVCGKRKRDSSYDSFSGWTEDLLSEPFDDCNNEIFPNNESQNTCTTIKKEPVSHVDKKRKLSEDEDLSLFITDASSRSPPFNALDFDLESVPVENILAPQNLEVSVESPSTPAAPSSLTNVLNIISNTDNSIRNAMFDSLSRIANKLEQGKSPLGIPQGSSPLEQIEASQDSLSMQSLFGVTMRPPTMVKAEQQYYPITAAGIPFMMNSSYAIPNMSMKMPVQDMSAYALKQNYALYSSACSKNMLYPTTKYMSPQTFTPMPIPTQNIYPQSASRVL